MDNISTTAGLITEREYQTFQRFLEQACGIVLGADKGYLVASRLSWIMNEQGFSSINELLQQLESGATSTLKAAVIDAMTTNETFWFRDKAHFELLRNRVLPELAAKSRRRPRIWSSACSSGQEPYSICMLIDEFRSNNPNHLQGGVEILASDISRTMVEAATKGVYCGFAAGRGLNDRQRDRFFQDRGQCLEVRDDFKRQVVFREMNLTHRFETLGRFDVIFCRNVLIYFSLQKKQEILGRFIRCLNPGGYLFLGSTEALSAHSDRFEMIKESGGIAYRLLDD
ncbi:MAG: protein-glutamate O-methyltransferase CheR [Candidatus Sedimenticola sp. 6PFRAG7]